MRKTDAAEKSYHPDDPGSNYVHAAFGKHADASADFLLVMEGYELGCLAELDLGDTPSDHLKEHREHWMQRFKERVAQAVLNHDLGFLAKLHSLLVQATDNKGPFDPVRAALQTWFHKLRDTLGRNPTIPELQHSSNLFTALSQSQFSRILKALGLECTPVKRLQRILREATKIKNRAGNVEIAALRAALKKLNQDPDLVSCEDDNQLLVYCESAGVEFALRASLKAHHAVFVHLQRCLPSVHELLANLPEYCRAGLSIDSHEKLRKACQRERLPLATRMRDS